MDFQDAKEEIRDRLDIVEVIGQYVRLEPAGARFRGLCPFHQEKTPSFYVHPERGLWHCFGCGKGGDLFSFVMESEGLSFPEALRMLARRAGVRIETDPQAAARQKRRDLLERANEIARDHFIHTLFDHPQAEHARDYLRSRGFNRRALENFQVGFALESWDDLLNTLAAEGINPSIAEEAGLAKAGERGGYYDTFRNRITFPIGDTTGRTIAFGGRTLDPDNPAKYLNSPETPLFRKRRTLYALHLARDTISREKRALIVEGYTDVIALHQAGLQNVVAGLGTALTAQQLDLLGRYADEVVLIYDADAAGARAALNNLEVVEAADVSASLVVLPEGMDPDEFVRAHGPEAFTELLEQRISPVEYQLRMIFAEHEGQGPDGGALAAREAVDVLLRVRDWPRRDEFVRRAADIWGAGDPSRTESMARALKFELTRRMGDETARRRPSSRDSSYITRTLTTPPDGLLRAETELLMHALSDGAMAREVAQNLEPTHMVSEQDATILAALKEHLDGRDDLDVQALIDGLPQEGGVWSRGVELTVRQIRHTGNESEDVLRAQMETAIRRLREHRRSGGALAATLCEATPPVDDDDISVEDFSQLEHEVIEGLNTGELSSDDELVRQYFAICRRLRGAGDRGFVGDGEAPREGVPEADEPPAGAGGREDEAADTGRAEAPGGVRGATPRQDPWAVDDGDPFSEDD